MPLPSSCLLLYILLLTGCRSRQRGVLHKPGTRMEFVHVLDANVTEDPVWALQHSLQLDYTWYLVCQHPLQLD